MLTLPACSPAPSTRFAIGDAAIDHGVLLAHLDWKPDAQLLDALDNGIALDFEIRLRAEGMAHLGWRPTRRETRWRRELRYFPLSRHYSLADRRDDASVTLPHSYASRALLLAAMTDLRLELPAAWSAASGSDERYALRIDLLRDNLPSALRLPAMLDPRWRVSTGNHRWPASALPPG